MPWLKEDRKLLKRTIVGIKRRGMIPFQDLPVPHDDAVLRLKKGKKKPLFNRGAHGRAALKGPKEEKPKKRKELRFASRQGRRKTKSWF